MRDALTPWLGAVQAWVATAALHTLALGLVALLLDRVLPRASAAARELVWRVALLGGLLTASLQLGVGIDPWVGSWRALASESLTAATPSVPGAFSAVSSEPSLATAVAWHERLTRVDVATLAWLALAAFALVHLAWVYSRLRRGLSPRAPSASLRDHAVALATALRLSRVPLITTSARATTPLALGLLHPEVCVSDRAVREFDAAELHAMLAHELAHVRRRDPAWSLLYALVCRALFFHPLLWVARRRLLALAELRCDAIARSTHPQAGVALARALVRAAEWLAHAPRGVGMAHGQAMAATTSGLQRRVRLLLEGAPRRSRVGSSLARALVLAFCGSAPFVLPDVRAIDPRPPIAVALDPVVAASLPAPVVALARDIAALRVEVDAIRELLGQSTLADDLDIGTLMRAIDARLAHLEVRCGRVIDQFRFPSRPSDLPLENPR